MEEQEKINIPQERLSKQSRKKSFELLNGKNNIYNISVVLLDIAILTLFWIIIANKWSVESSEIIFSGLDKPYIYLMLSLVATIIILSTLFNFLQVYTHQKTRNFGVFFVENIYKNFYNNTTFSKCGHYVSETILENIKISPAKAVDSVYQKKISDKIAILIYSFIFLILGAIFCLKNDTIILLICAFIVFIIEFSYILFIVFFEKNKQKSINFLGKIEKILYKLKIIKDLDLFYSNVVSSHIEYSQILKNKKATTFMSVVFSMIILFARHILLFVILETLNFSSDLALLEILFKCSIMDLIIDFLPLPRGLFIYELLFVLLFNTVFFEGYLAWAMVIYRVLDYTLYALLFMIIYFIPKKYDRVVK